MALGLHCLCMRAAGNSFLFLLVRGVIPKTSPNITESVPAVAFSALDTPTSAMSLPVPIGQTLWWRASLSSNWRTSVWARLGCRKATLPCGKWKVVGHSETW